MTYEQFTTNHHHLVALVKPGTLRQWRNRDNVPESAVTKLTEGVTEPASVTEPPVTESKPVAGVTTALILSPDGNAAFDIMPDGMARGFPGDSLSMRRDYRTPGAIRRHCEARDADTPEIKAACQRWLLGSAIGPILRGEPVAA